MDAPGDAPRDVPGGRATGRATERAKERARRRARGRHGPSHTARATIWRELQLIRAVLHCAASCCAELCCSLLRCGSSYPWHPNPVRTDMDLKLKLPMRMVRPKLAAVETCGAVNQLELKIRFSSEVGRTDRGSNPNRNESQRDDDKAPARHLLKQCKTSVSRETSSTHLAEGAFRCRRGPRSRHPQQILQNERSASDILNKLSC